MTDTPQVDALIDRAGNDTGRTRMRRWLGVLRR